MEVVIARGSGGYYSLYVYFKQLKPVVNMYNINKNNVVGGVVKKWEIFEFEMYGVHFLGKPSSLYLSASHDKNNYKWTKP